MLKKLFAAAGLAGLLAGSLLTVVQQLHVKPILLEAERYEESAVLASAGGDPASKPDHAHDEGWKPANGLERTLFTLGSNVVLGIGLALLLGALACMRGKIITWRSGLLWGVGGYAVFFAAPSLGLPPDVPGAEAATLADRQLWWLLAVFCTGTALWLFAFVPNFFLKLLGILLLGLPHLIGAPQPHVHSSVAPAELAHAFIYACIYANAVFWLLLGGSLGFFHQKLA
jgi:cobalt transporter subunit CbtA